MSTSSGYFGGMGGGGFTSSSGDFNANDTVSILPAFAVRPISSLTSIELDFVKPDESEGEVEVTHVEEFRDTSDPRIRFGVKRLRVYLSRGGVVRWALLEHTKERGLSWCFEHGYQEEVVGPALPFAPKAKP